MQHLTIANQWISSLLRAFAGQGLDLSEITRGLKGFEKIEIIKGARIELSDARIMWHRAEEQSDDPLLGLKVGLTQDFRAVGVLAPIIWHSPTVREALTNIQRYQKLISESGQYQAFTDENTTLVRFEYVPNANRVPAAPHQILAVVIGTIGGIAEISHGTVMPTTLIVPEPLCPELICQALESQAITCPVETGTGHFSIVYDTEFFDVPLQGCDAYLYEINKAYAEELLLAKNESLALISQVKRFVIEQGAAASSIDQLATYMQLNKRTVQRFLKSQGTSFREVKEETLKELAVKFLIHEKLDIETIANRLKYSETSAFHRAFRQWFGVSPRQFGRLA